MGKRIHQQMVKARKHGMTPTDVLRMREITKQEVQKMEAQALEKGFISAMTVIFNPLIEYYWKKSAKKRIPVLAEDAVDLWKALEVGVVDYEDCVAYLEEQTGMTFNSEWITHTGNARKIDGLKEKMQELLKEAENG